MLRMAAHLRQKSPQELIRTKWSTRAYAQNLYKTFTTFTFTTFTWLADEAKKKFEVKHWKLALIY